MNCNPLLGSVLGIALFGCTGGPHAAPAKKTDTSGSANAPECSEVRTVVGLGDQTALGVAAQDFYALLGTWDAQLDWKNPQGNTTLAVDLDPESLRAEYVARTPIGPHDGGCSDSLELTTQTSFATGDGAFAESWTAVWSYSPAGSGPLSLQTSIQVDPEDLTGSFIPAAPPGSCVRDVVVSIHLRADYFGGDILHHIVTACASAPTTGVSDVWDGTWASE